MDMSMLADQIANLLFIVSKSHCKVDITVLYAVIIKMWNTINHPRIDFYVILVQLVKKHRPDIEAAKTLVKNIIYNANDDTKMNYIESTIQLCYILDEEIHKVILELSNSDACMAFMLNPLHYKDYDSTKVEWLWVLPKHIKAGLMTIPHYKDMVKQYIADNKLNKESLKYLTNLL